MSLESGGRDVNGMDEDPSCNPDRGGDIETVLEAVGGKRQGGSEDGRGEKEETVVEDVGGGRPGGSEEERGGEGEEAGNEMQVESQDDLGGSGDADPGERVIQESVQDNKEVSCYGVS